MTRLLALGVRSSDLGRGLWAAIAWAALSLAIVPLCLSCNAGSLPAFPGAEGFGANSTGGRRGRVIEVTNLDDIDSATGKAVPGSLRAAIETPEPRIVVFRVSGIIDICEMNQALNVQEPYITIAGQTAPGDGITLRLDPTCSASALTIWTHDVVVRHLRIRSGSNPTVDLGDSDALKIAGPSAHDIIIDHCSFSWATDEDVDINSGANNITVQYSIISEALKDAPRNAVGPSGGYGMLIDEGDQNGNHTEQISIHHNLFAHNWYRNPQVSIDGLIDYRNNLIYDWGLHGLRLMDVYGPTRMNIVGNYAKPGPSTSTSASVHEVWAYHSIGKPPLSYFALHNIGPRRPSSSLPELDIIYCREHYDAVANSGVDCNPANFAVPAFPTAPVGTALPAAAYDTVLLNAGATLPRRDVVDLRVVDDVRNGTGRDVANPAEVGGWPKMMSATAPSDRDHDAMPDAWETQYGLNPDGGSNATLDLDADGYTNVEEFLNGTNPLLDQP